MAYKHYYDLLFSLLFLLDDALEHQVSGMGRSLPSQTSHEPNLNSVIDFLSSPNPSNVANAASYLQHLAYGDDSMKSKIRYQLRSSARFFFTFFI